MLQQTFTFLSKHAALVAGIITVALFLILDELRAWWSDKHALSANQAAIDIAKSVPIYDIRSKPLYNESRVQNAKWVKLEKLLEMPDKVLSPDQRVIIYCQDGTMSQEAATKLRQKHGFKVDSIHGGFNVWKQEGFSTER